MKYNETLSQISSYEFEIAELYKKIDDFNLKRLKLEAEIRKHDYPHEKENPNQWMIDHLEEKEK